MNYIHTKVCVCGHRREANVPATTVIMSARTIVCRKCGRSNGLLDATLRAFRLLGIR